MKTEIEMLRVVADKKNPKKCLNYIAHFTNGDLVATDTKRMLIIETENKPTENILLDCNNVGEHITGYDPIFNLPFKLENNTYPSYKGLILNDDVKKVPVLSDTFLSILQEVPIITGCKIDLIGVASKWKKLAKLKVENIYFRDKDTPIMLTGVTKNYFPFKLIIMPIVY